MEGAGGLRVLLVLVVAAYVTAAPPPADTDTSTPPALHGPSHTTTPAHEVSQQEGVVRGPGAAVVGAPGGVEDEYLDDALGDWLARFPTYTFMVQQDIVSSRNHIEDDEEEGEETREEGEGEERWSAPIAVSVGEGALLDPRLDHDVLVESLVAEEGAVFLTLSGYSNKTTCGVGGFSRVTEVEAGQVEGAVVEDHTATTVVSFDLEGHNVWSSFAGGVGQSWWDEVSREYWWARGRLAGGGLLSLKFTPPECGCLTLSTYYALPVGTLTLVVGPQAYPSELRTLLCVDPAATYEPLEEDYDEEELADEDDSANTTATTVEMSASSTSLNLDQPEETDISEDGDQPIHPLRRNRRRKARKENKKLSKRERRRLNRQQIRQAGRRNARAQDVDENGQVSERRNNGNGRNRNLNKKQVKKAWKKLKRQRKNRRRQRQHLHMNGSEPEEENEDEEGEVMVVEVEVGHEDTNHTASHPAQQGDDGLIHMLLSGGAEEVGNNATTATPTLQEAVQEEEESEGSAAEDAAMTPRRRKKNKRKQRKLERKEKKKMYPTSTKFCCKQGVKRKKYLLVLEDSDDTQPASSCGQPDEVVLTFATHQFNATTDECQSTFIRCCSNFTEEMWNRIKANKMARRQHRQERRKSRRQNRRQQRKQRGKQHRRGGRRRNSLHHHHQHKHQEEEEGGHELETVEAETTVPQSAPEQHPTPAQGAQESATPPTAAQ